MQFFLLMLIVLGEIHARDLSDVFARIHKINTPFTREESLRLSGYEYALVPGILSESFIREDQRSSFEFSFLTQDYFGAQLRFLANNKLKVRRVQSSSFSVDDTKEAIHALLSNSEKKVIFITHSLGGLALLDYLLENEEFWSQVGGVIFLQSPFLGAPIASVLLHSPPVVQKIVASALLFFHTSQVTIDYLSMENRRNFILKNKHSLKRLSQAIPLLTFGGVANGHLSLFRSSANIIRHGCMNPVLGKCLTRVYPGPFDDNDGMVPFQSSQLPDVDFIRLEGVDHGETVVEDFVGSIDRKRMTQAILKVFVQKLSMKL